ncbi:MAG: hypothetical protein ABW032_09760 [Burkholderiaceae bacterium]
MLISTCPARLAVLACLSTTAFAAPAAAPRLNVQFSQCSEFVGLVPIDAAKAQAQLPSRYALVVDAANTARLVVRMTDCRAIRVGQLPAHAGRLAQVGLMIVSPDGTAGDPNTGINNYTLTYASNVPELVAGLLASGVPAALDAQMEYQVTPPLGAHSALYAAVAPEFSGSPRFFLDGAVNTPTFGTTFLANWWRLDGPRQTRMQTNFPTIAFDFGSSVAFTTSSANPIGQLLGATRVSSFAITYRGTYDAATMTVDVGR